MRYKGLTIVLFAVVTVGFVFGFLNYHKKLDAMLGKEIVQASTGDFNLPALPGDVEEEEPSGNPLEKGLMVPSLTGLSKEEAISALEELELVPEFKEVYSDEFSKGTVFGQFPLEDASIEKGDEVIFSVSLGEEDPEESTAQIVVPNLIGMAKEAAEDELKEMGFNVAFEYNPSDHYDEGYVYSQNYKVGAKVSWGTQVTIRISTGRS